jgi:hypothetical protein
MAIETRSLASIALAAARHFASLGKSRNAVLPETPPATDPLKTTVTNIKVHMSSLLSTIQRSRRYSPRAQLGNDAQVARRGGLSFGRFSTTHEAYLLLRLPRKTLESAAESEPAG